MSEEEARHWDLFINGSFIPAQSGKYFKTINPATGEQLARVAEGDSADVDRAVHAAREALLGPWGNMSATERGRILQQIAGAIATNADRLALLDCQDAGRLLADVRHKDLERCQTLFEFYAGLADKIQGNTYPTPQDFFAYSIREPYGVVGAIIPWNAPLPAACGKIAPALACGNTVILKPAEQAPLSSLELARICHEAGLPKGVLNVVPGYGPTAGAALVRHPRVDKVAFTGSTETGRQILAMSAPNLRSVTLELGGKTPNIIFKDADLDAALDAAAFSPFYHAGQICVAGTRLFVERDIANDFVDRLVAKTHHIRVGDPAKAETMVGPIISKEQLARVTRYIELGQNEGARLLVGGESPTEPALNDGYFMKPTVFDRVNSSMRIAQEEIFGPVLSVFPFDSEEEMLTVANNVHYGLAAAVWTKDIARATRLARRLEAGMVWLNMLGVIHPTVPYSGFKQSGIGLEYGVESIETYTRLKTVWSNVGGVKIGW